jgi:hypothetical protein
MQKIASPKTQAMPRPPYGVAVPFNIDFARFKDRHGAVK